MKRKIKQQLLASAGAARRRHHHRLIEWGGLRDYRDGEVNPSPPPTLAKLLWLERPDIPMTEREK